MASEEPTVMRSIENGGQESSQAADPVPEIPLHLLEDTSTHIQSKRLIMGIDFGTTFSAISYVALAPGEATDLVLSNRIQSIRNYPDDMNDNSTDPMKKEVPTEVIYPMVKGFRKKAKLELTTDEVINQHDRDMAGRASHVDIMDVDEEEDDYDPMDEGNPEEFQWGYGVHQTLKFRESYLNTQQMALTRFKLLLHEDPATEPVRERLRPTIDILRSRGIIKENVMIIADYLTYLLRHAKRELQIQNLYEGYQIEIVLCVPAIWSQQAGRDMQAALSTALLGADFKGVDVQNKSIMNLFVVSEPEAAATYVLEHERRIKPNDTFVLLDAGGGTVDANTYTVTQTTPLRLKAEGAPPEGGLYGSSYLNEKFRKYIRDLLSTETYLEDDGDTLDSIADTMTVDEFEYRCKRNHDIYNPGSYPRNFPCHGLRENLTNSTFRRNRLRIKNKDIKDIFMECLTGIKALMESQILAARARDTTVNKVVLIGGFAGSPSLRTYLERSLDNFRTERGIDIKLIIPDHDVSAVASGAVLRALNKERGPEREARSSYGIVRTEPCVDFHVVEKLKAYRDDCDGELYIRNTIDWVLKRGEHVPSVWQSEPLRFTHMIRCHPLPKAGLVCEETLYVSDSSTESHYPKGHKKNIGCRRVGVIVCDFNFLKEENLIQRTRPMPDEKGKQKGVWHYKIQYTIIIRVVDRDLKCFAFYDGKLINSCRLSIASGFLPGVK